MTPTRRKGTFNSGVALVEGAGCGEDGGWRMEDGAFGSVASGDADKKPVFKGVCAAYEICGGVIEDGFSFSGKFGSTEVSGALNWWGEATDEPGSSGIWLPSGSRERSPHRLVSDGSE